jgi:hypothetical protein
MRQRTFANRVIVEREVLTLINQGLGHCATLSGLTEAAIHDFARRNGLPQSDRIIALLRQISVKSELRSDCSKDSFDGDQFVNKDDLGRTIKTLCVEINQREQRLKNFPI